MSTRAILVRSIGAYFFLEAEIKVFGNFAGSRRAETNYMRGFNLYKKPFL